MLKHFLVPEADQVLVSEQAARSGTQALFEAMGMPYWRTIAALCAEGRSSSRAILRTAANPTASPTWCTAYLEMYAAGRRLNPTPDVKTLRESPVSATLSNRWTPTTGSVCRLAPNAMDVTAMDKACGVRHQRAPSRVQNCGR